MSKTILLMAGGTGGHVFPALAVADVLRRRGFDVQWLGAEQGIENRLVPAAGISLHKLDVRGVRGNGLKRKLGMPLMLIGAILKARTLIRHLRPVLVVGFGGFASGPGGLASRLTGTPLIIHEQNARAGLTNRVLARLACRVLEGFSGAFPGKGVSVGNPVRAEICNLADPEQRYAERTGPVRILVMGGSQGALALNRDLPELLAGYFKGQSIEVRHQAGKGRISEAAQRWQATWVEANVIEFIEDMAEAYAWADLVICRAGASTVAEVAAAGVAAVFVPLPTAVDDHQSANAGWLVDQGAARLLPQTQLNEQGLQKALDGLATRDALMSLAGRARRQALPGSAEHVADICQEVAHG